SADDIHEESFVTPAEDILVVGAQDGVVALAKADGKERWRLAVEGAERSALGDDVLYVGGRGSGVLTAVGLDGLEKWRFDTGAEEVLTPTVRDDRVLVATRGPAGGVSPVTALDLQGNELWTVELEGRIGSHGADADRVYVTIAADPSTMFALDPAT